VGCITCRPLGNLLMAIRRGADKALLTDIKQLLARHIG
jgi:hypothetical protein